MLSSITKGLAVAVAGAATPLAVHGQGAAAPQACSLAADSTSLDAQTNRGVFRKVRIICQDFDIEADEAIGTEVVPQQGEWELTGNIKIALNTAVITADSATFGFADSDLVFGELSGSPAVLVDVIPDDDTPVRATAGLIYYDNVGRTARMEQGASLVLGTSEMSGCGDIIYDLNRGLVDSVSNCGEPFVIRFLPKTDDSPDEPTPPR
jgi:lipopolysaccharide export system protein LptA